MPFMLLALLFCILLSVATESQALGPRNVVVLARTDSPDSLRIANAYVSARGIPHENLILLPYTGSPHHCTWEVFERDVLKPTKKALEQRKLEKTVHVWATTLGIPWRIDGNGLSGVVYFGRVIQPTKSANLGPAGYEEASKYAGVWLSIDAFNSLPQSEHRPLHMHLAAGNVESTLKMIERSANADGSFPTGTFYLCDGGGPRSSRKHTISRAMQLLQVQGAKVEHFAGATFTGKRDILGLFTGDISFPTAENGFLPGSLADHLTSTGGVLDGTGGQMMCTAFLDAGCSASYGTVVEPYNYPMKFPAAATHAAYRAGFTAVESYWMTVAWPQQGIFVGDPLARPFGKPPEVKIAVVNGRSASFKGPLLVGNEIVIAAEATTDRPSKGIGGIEFQIDGKSVGGVGQQRLPPEATIELQISDKKYRAASPTPSVLADLLQELKKQLEKEGMEVATTAASLMIRRSRTNTPASIAASCGSKVLHAEVVGGRFVSEDGADGKEFAWVRFSTGPSMVAFQGKIDVSQLVDGEHVVTATAVSGDETKAARTSRDSVVKRTKTARLRLQRRVEIVHLAKQKDRVVVAEAKLEGEGLSGPIEFLVDGRVVEIRNKPPFVFTVDPAALGVGGHRVSARATNPAQNADESFSFLIAP